MKVKIIKCSNNNWWYKYNIGIEFEVAQEDEEYYYVQKDIFRILKSDCEVIKSRPIGTISVSEKLLIDTELKDEVKNCNTCKYANKHYSSSPCSECEWKIGNYSLWKPKLPDEKPKVEKVKKYKYVCSSCFGVKCTCVMPSKGKPIHCGYIDAKWKLKKEIVV